MLKPGQAPTIRVLIADDVSDLRSMLRIVLESWGSFEIVAEAGDGAEAVALTEAYLPHAVVLDLSMPVMDGLEAIPEIRRRAPGIHIVVLSGFASEAMETVALSQGADAYLEKIDAVPMLAATLERVCSEVSVR